MRQIHSFQPTLLAALLVCSCLLCQHGAAQVHTAEYHPTVHHPTHRRRHHSVQGARSRTLTIPHETAPTPPDPERAAEQRAQDQRLLKQQQTQSAKDAAVVNETVRKAQAQADAQRPSSGTPDPAVTPPGMKPVDSEDHLLTPPELPQTPPQT